MATAYHPAWRSSAPVRFLTRTYRRLPRGIVLGLLLVIEGIIAKNGVEKYVPFVLGSLRDIQYDLHAGFWLLAGVSSALLIGSGAAAGVLSMFGLYAAIGLTNLTHPIVSRRRQMRNAFRIGLGLTGVSFVCQIIAPILLTIAGADQASQNLGTRAVWQLDQMRTSTVERIASEERSGHWWSDADDTAPIRDVKYDMMRTNAAGRAFVWKIIEIRLQKRWEPRHPIA